MNKIIDIYIDIDNNNMRNLTYNKVWGIIWTNTVETLHLKVRNAIGNNMRTVISKKSSDVKRHMSELYKST